MRQQLLAIFICLMKQYLSNTNLGNIMYMEASTAIVIMRCILQMTSIRKKVSGYMAKTLIIISCINVTVEVRAYSLAPPIRSRIIPAFFIRIIKKGLRYVKKKP